MAIQSNYNRRPEAGFPGLLARSEEIHIIERGVAQVADGTTAISPGQALYYDKANNGFARPSDAATAARIVGICSYMQSSIQNTGSTNRITFADGAELRIGTFGTFWITAGVDMEWGDTLYWDHTDSKWKVSAATAAAAGAYAQATLAAISLRAGRLPITCVSPQPITADNIAEARFGHGYVA